MKCNEIKDRIVESYEDGEVKDREALTHMEGCRSCKAFQESLEKVRATLPLLEAPALPEGFARRVAAMASEQAAPRGLVKTFAGRVTEALATLLLGRQRATVPGAVSTGLLFSLFTAAVAGLTMVASLYMAQCNLLFGLRVGPAIISQKSLHALLWMPFVKEMDWRIFYQAASMVILASGVMLFFGGMRMLNMRAYWEALRSGRKLPPMAVALPLVALFAMLLLWHLMVFFADAFLNGHGISLEWPVYRGIPFFFSNLSLPFLRHHSDTLSMVLLASNPFVTPLGGVLLSGFALVLLLTRSVRHVPALVYTFYGCLGGIALSIALPQAKAYDYIARMAFPWMENLLSGPESSAATRLLLLALPILLFGAAGAFMSALRFEEQRKRERFFTETPVPALLFGTALAGFALLLAFPAIQKDRTLRDSCRSLISNAHRNTYTVVPLVSVGIDTMDRTFPGGMKTSFYPAAFDDERLLSKAEDGARRSHDENLARSIAMTAMLSRWDSDGFIKSWLSYVKECSPTHYYLYPRNFIIVNGREHEESLSLLDQLSDEKTFFISDSVRLALGMNYLLLGKSAKAQGLFSKISEPYSREELVKCKKQTQDFPLTDTGKVSGTVIVNGLPVRGIKVRLFASETLFRHYSFYDRFYNDEHRFLWDISEALGQETRKAFSSVQGTLPTPLAFSGSSFIVTETDSEGRFTFRNLLSGSYLAVLRFPGKPARVTELTPVGIINVTAKDPSRDIGTVKLEVEQGEVPKP
ncbi:MAG: hypothetical protein RDV48_02500 [Candidatus Eremiobacteraeota bacterium]|nr:hypothetical protein [Candidatus Eremiobacteraeota bacterium]